MEGQGARREVWENLLCSFQLAERYARLIGRYPQRLNHEFGAFWRRKAGGLPAIALIASDGVCHSGCHLSRRHSNARGMKDNTALYAFMVGVRFQRMS
jgi:hypothetical protein